MRLQPIPIFNLPYSRKAQLYQTCPYRQVTGKQFCYNRRCKNPQCRRKEAWKEDCIFQRSCAWLPPTHFITLDTPWRYYGVGFSKIINRFICLLERMSGGSIHQQWRYDSTAKGRWPHVHMLARCTLPITSEMVSACWEPLWIDDYDGEICSADCKSIYDVEKAIVYFTKVDRFIPRISKQEWYGRMSGGNRSFFCTSKKALWVSSYYRDNYNTAKWMEMERELERCYPCMVRDLLPVELTVKVAVTTVKHRRLQLPIVYINRLVNRFGLSWYYSCSYVKSLATVSYCHHPKNRKRLLYTIGNCQSNQFLRYSVWANAP